MAVIATAFYRNTLTNLSATLWTTQASATTVITNIVATNKTASATTFTIAIGGVNIVYQMPILPGQTITLDLKQTVAGGVAVTGLAGASSAVDLHISGAVVTGQDGTFTAFAPTWTQAATITNTGTARYVQSGKLTVVTYNLTATSAGTASNPIKLTLPVNAAAAGRGGGTFWYQDTGAANYTGFCHLDSTSTITLYRNADAGAFTGVTVASTDVLTAQVTYEAA